MKGVVVRASPSLALIKYWGKSNDRRNIPATSSLAVTLDGLYSTTHVNPADRDEVTIDSKPQPSERFGQLFDRIRSELDTDMHFRVASSNNFATAGGLASSASGIAALVFGCARLLESDASIGSLSSLARIGSASAARSFYDGFTILEADTLEAKQLYPKSFWPSFRIVVVAVTRSQKALSSRDAMRRARDSSPF